MIHQLIVSFILQNLQKFAIFWVWSSIGKNEPIMIQIFLKPFRYIGDKIMGKIGNYLFTPKSKTVSQEDLINGLKKKIDETPDLSFRGNQMEEDNSELVIL